MALYFDIFVFIFGAAIGSFLNVVILRLPNDEHVTGRSHCPHCGHTLGALELIPLVSFVLLGGKCSSCKANISPRYFIIEGITGLLFLVGWLHFNPLATASWLLFAEWMVVSAAALAIFVIDLEHYLILDVIVFPVLIIVCLLALASDISSGHSIFSFHSLFVSSLLGAAAGSAPFFLIWYFSKGKWMGFGDVKLLLLLGAATGLRLVPVVVLLAIFSGGAVSSVLLIGTKKTLKSHIPLGTFLSISLLVTLVWGQNILRWYLGILGF